MYAAILTSPALRRMVLPEGLLPSPYEILEYNATLTLDNPEGQRATFRRYQRIRFLQDRVSGMLDHLWGDGVGLTYYDNDAGRLIGSFVDKGRRHVLISLRRPMERGEVLSLRVERMAVAAFTRDEEWVETTIDHPIAHLRRNVVFPPERPCRAAVLHVDGYVARLPVLRLGGGRTVVRFDVVNPRPHAPYTVRWVW